jgi:hypothetical protein
MDHPEGERKPHIGNTPIISKECKSQLCEFAPFVEPSVAPVTTSPEQYTPLTTIGQRANTPLGAEPVRRSTRMKVPTSNTNLKDYI